MLLFSAILHTISLTIDTLKQLAESPIACGAWGDQTKQFFQTSLDETSQRIGAKLEETDNVAEAVIIKISCSFFQYIDRL